MLWKSLEAADLLAQEGIDAEVINIHTIKPLDEDAILTSARKTKCVVTAEEHMLNGGLGSLVAKLLSTTQPMPLEMIGVDDTFGESGTPDALLKKYHLDTDDIVNAVKRVTARK